MKGSRKVSPLLLETVQSITRKPLASPEEIGRMSIKEKKKLLVQQELIIESFKEGAIESLHLLASKLREIQAEIDVLTMSADGRDVAYDEMERVRIEGTDEDIQREIERIEKQINVIRRTSRKGLMAGRLPFRS